ncbi:MAG: 5-methyltetrahydropteroyltriglutamate--homocysteine S-methyltransferase, partial [Brevinematales bacterium]
YFALARGFQSGTIDIKAWPMKKWFFTNYHYVVPKLTPDISWTPDFSFFSQKTQLALEEKKPTRITLVGPYTFYKLSRRENISATLLKEKLLSSYQKIFNTYSSFVWQLDEPALVLDMNTEDKEIFSFFYQQLAPVYGKHIHLQTYFGDIQDLYKEVISLPIRSLGLDFIDGKGNHALLEQYGFPQDKILYAGILSGRNIWKSHPSTLLPVKQSLERHTTHENIVLSTSCSLLHVPYTLQGENPPPPLANHLSFAMEKIEELKNIASQWNNHSLSHDLSPLSSHSSLLNPELQKTIEKLGYEAFHRPLPVEKRLPLQKKLLKLPLFPTTTIGSFPQTKELRKIRKAYQEGSLSPQEYEEQLRTMIQQCVIKQEEIGLDVLVHGEYERNDMVEYFANFLSGFWTSKHGWVQSYGSRATKPPIIYGDIKRLKSMTVPWITYAQSLTKKPMKAILTGPITIINWSFCREDVSLREVAYQIALAIREEIDELQKNGIPIIQVDEAALREKLPLRKKDWQEYLEISTSAFRLATSGIKPETQLHTHMCYSEFSEIADAIEAMDADVLTIEASRSDLDVIESLRNYSQKRDIGPGVYDIHSPRIPSEEEIMTTIQKLLTVIPAEHLWINPDCGLKTRQEHEAYESLTHMVRVAQKLRENLP